VSTTADPFGRPLVDVDADSDPHADADELKEIRGPSSLGGGWRRSWDLLYLMAVNEFRRAYFNTALGYIWSIGRPLLTFGVLLVVFTKELHISAGIPHYSVLLLMNIVLFGFFQEGTGTALPSIVASEAIVRKTQFPRLVIPVASVLTAVFNLAINLVVVLAFVLAFGVSPHWTWLLMPVLLVLLMVITLAVAMILSSLYPRFRDMAVIWTVVSTALFYGTPVIYALGSGRVSHRLDKIIALNPLSPIFVLARKWIVDPHAPGLTSVTGGGLRLLIPIVLYIAICGLAVWVFQREAPRIAEAL
jgi:ABC-2 type transport system permease protein